MVVKSVENQKNSKSIQLHMQRRKMPRMLGKKEARIQERGFGMNEDPMTRPLCLKFQYSNLIPERTFQDQIRNFRTVFLWIIISCLNKLKMFVIDTKVGEENIHSSHFHQQNAGKIATIPAFRETLQSLANLPLFITIYSNQSSMLECKFVFSQTIFLSFYQELKLKEIQLID